MEKEGEGINKSGRATSGVEQTWTRPDQTRHLPTTLQTNQDTRVVTRTKRVTTHCLNSYTSHTLSRFSTRPFLCVWKRVSDEHVVSWRVGEWCVNMFPFCLTLVICVSPPTALRLHSLLLLSLPPLSILFSLFHTLRFIFPPSSFFPLLITFRL